MYQNKNPKQLLNSRRKPSELIWAEIVLDWKKFSFNMTDVKYHPQTNIAQRLFNRIRFVCGLKKNKSKKPLQMEIENKRKTLFNVFVKKISSCSRENLCFIKLVIFFFLMSLCWIKNKVEITVATIASTWAISAIIMWRRIK